MQNKKYILAASIFIVAIAIASYLWLALSMRMIADDYCLTRSIRDFGVIGTLKWYYMGWSGQFTYPFAKAIIYYSLGLNAHFIMPIVVYVFWWAGNFYLLWIVFDKFSLKAPRLLSFSLSTLHIFILLSTMASRQTMYWLDALLFHVLPLVLFSWIAIAWLIALESQKWLKIKIGIFFILSFVYAGMHILTTLFGLAVWLLAIILIWRYFTSETQKAALSITFASFIGTLIAFSVVVLAPGNLNRLDAERAGIGMDIHLIDAVGNSLQSAVRLWFAPFSLAHFFFVIVIVIAICTLWDSWGYIPRNHTIIEGIRQHAFLIITVSILLGILYSWGSLFLPTFSYGRANSRVFVTAGLVKTWVSLWIGFVLGLRYAQTINSSTIKHIFVIFAFVLLIIGSSYRIYGNLQLLPAYNQWSQEWDARHSALLEASQNGALIVELKPFSTKLPKFLGPDTDAARIDFALTCMESYYGIATIQINETLDNKVLQIIETR